VHEERYKVILEQFLRIELRPRQQDLLCFQQGGANSPTAEIAMQVLRIIFLGRRHYLARPLT